MSKNEYARLRSLEPHTVYPACSEAVYVFLNSLIANMREFDEAPDMYSVVEGENWAVEHFEVNASKSSRNGSSITKELSKLSDSDGVRPVESCFSRANFVENFKETFNAHRSKTENYKQNLKETIGSGDLKICFWVETKYFPSNVLINSIAPNAPKPLSLAKFQECIELIDASTEIDLVIHTIDAGIFGRFISIIDRSNLGSYKQTVLSEGWEVLTNHPHALRYSAEILKTNAPCLVVFRSI